MKFSPLIDAQITARKEAERNILELLHKSESLSIPQLVKAVPGGEWTIRRAALRLLASGRLRADINFMLSLVI